MPFMKRDNKSPQTPLVQPDVRPDQKLCKRCRSLISFELQRCPFCGNAPWRWHPNARFLVLTLIICIFLFVLFPLLNNRDKTYRVPVTDTEDEAAP